MTNKGAELKKQLAARLKQISEGLSSQDKRDAANSLQVHYNTINNYLKGDIGDVDVAISLIELFTERIDDKIKRLKRLSTQKAA